MVALRKQRQRGVPMVILAMVMPAFVIIVLQGYNIHSRVVFSSMWPSFKISDAWQKNSPRSPTLLRIGKFSASSDLLNSTEPLALVNYMGSIVQPDNKGEPQLALNAKLIDASSLKDEAQEDDEDNTDWDVENVNHDISGLGEGTSQKEVRDRVDGFVELKREKTRETATSVSLVSDGVTEPIHHSESKQTKTSPIKSLLPPLASALNNSDKDMHGHEMSNSKTNDSVHILVSSAILSAQQKRISISSQEDTAKSLPNNHFWLTKHDDAASLGSVRLENKASRNKCNNMSIANGSLSCPKQSHMKSTGKTYVVNKYNKDRQGIPSVSFSEMNSLLLRNLASYYSVKPRWSSSGDKQILDARSLINNAPILKNDLQLYAPVFRNVSMFKRSYELMEKILKVFVYKEGEKPVFHQTLLNGIYSSEGWFMKMLETNRQFVVKDSRRANMFYLPFSSRLLQLALYVPNSHNRTKMEQRLKDYIDMIAAKYPFWNRTSGADHFLVACHDWAPIQTMDLMGHTIRALCNADIRDGYLLGKDVSLLQSNILSSKVPLKYLGGRPPDQRSTLAFYAGNIHGTLRPILLHHWKNKDPDMKIFGPLPPSTGSKMKYIQYMKNSKYCICPRGHEVNSPRIVESISYECIPVIISDNYVLPFFEVLNWEAFSVIIPEMDVPRLKEILISIPREKYLSLHRGVRMVQQHFLWHNKPVKYDAFHMILHNIWYNRVFTIRTV